MALTRKVKQKIISNCLIGAAIFIALVVYFDKFFFDVVLIIDSWIKVYYRYVWDSRFKQMFSFDETSKLFTASDKDSPVILIWIPFFGYMVLDPFLCPGCIITYDRSLIKKASAVVFHCSETGENPSWLPLADRVYSQRWVWFCMEPPWKVRYVFQKTLTPLNGIFNWTMTFRLDSNVLAPYSIPFPLTNKTIDEIINDKTADALAAWVSSNCDMKYRIDILDELSNYILIDRFGKCSKQKLCNGACEKETLYKYKFFFSFENSLCKDYITEKFWVKAISYHVVPVVMGPPRSDYELVAPPNSFIHVDDFDSTKSLADYLIKLDRDDKLYKKYLRWMVIDNEKNYSSSKTTIKYPTKIDFNFYPFKKGICNLCKKLKQEEVSFKKISKNVVEKLDEWWFGKGYSPSSPIFSICNYKGPSGIPLRWHISITFYLFLLILVTIVFRRRVKYLLKS